MRLLRLQDVVKDYVSDGQPVRAVDHVSLELDAGDFVALVGRSGCGKSTLLNLAGAMDFPTSGDVWLNGTSTSRLDDSGLTMLRRETVGFVFQSFQLLHTLSVVENVELPLLLGAAGPRAGGADGSSRSNGGGPRHARARALETLAWVDLADLAHRLPHQLSGGQMQRVAIARALVHRPQLLLADEPTGNLDTATAGHILGLISRLNQEYGIATIVATHSSEAAAIAHRVIRLRDGRIDAAGELPR